jgi:hypothetical protein
MCYCYCFVVNKKTLACCNKRHYITESLLMKVKDPYAVFLSITSPTESRL